MRLTKEQFLILEAAGSMRVREETGTLAASEQKLHMEPAVFRKAMEELKRMELVDGGRITADGSEALEQYRVRRAIILAAGLGSRLLPVTAHTPKPLVKVNGVRIIDTIIDAVLAAGIEDITIVVGHLGEQFGALLKKYPMISFVDNPEYRECNNLTSLCQVRDRIENTYILDGDLLIYHPDIITRYQYASNYVGMWVEETEDWNLVLDQDGYICGMKLGGENTYLMYGVSYWTAEDGKRLKAHVEKVYSQPGGKSKYWDQVAIECYPEEYRLGVRNFAVGDIIEIDDYVMLKELDGNYTD